MWIPFFLEAFLAGSPDWRLVILVQCLMCEILAQWLLSCSCHGVTKNEFFVWLRTVYGLCDVSNTVSVLSQVKSQTHSWDCRGTRHLPHVFFIGGLWHLKVLQCSSSSMFDCAVILRLWYQSHSCVPWISQIVFPFGFLYSTVLYYLCSLWLRFFFSARCGTMLIAV